MEAGSRNGAFKMYLRSLVSNYVIPSDKNAEDILREYFWWDRDEYEAVEDLPKKFLEKYFTPDIMMELLEEQFKVEDNHREITAIIEAREILS